MDQFSLGNGNILLIFVIALLLIILESKRIVFGVVATILYVVLYNFMFLAPKLSFKIEDSSYIFTVIIFIIVSFLIGIITKDFHQQKSIVKEKNTKVNALYKASQAFSKSTKMNEIGQVFLDTIEVSLQLEAVLVMEHQNKLRTYHHEFTFDLKKYEEVIDFVFKTGNHIGKETPYYDHLHVQIFPISIGEKTRGVLILNCAENLPTNEDTKMIKILTNLLSIVVYQETGVRESDSKIAQTQKRYKNILQRSVTYDLDKPIQQILTQADYLLANYDELGKDKVLEMILHIYRMASQSTLFIDNFTIFSKIQNNELSLQNKDLNLHEVLQESIDYMDKSKSKHKIIMRKEKQEIHLKSDETLLKQVLCNLLSNATQHTKENAEVFVGYSINDEYVTITISDNGGGIDEKNIVRIFDEYLSIKSNKESAPRGAGLGLAVSKRIVKLMQGTITGYNNDRKGATFEIKLPVQKK